MRGFAQTAHCPRCETAHPTGGDVAPIISCLKCGLGFDPRRSREAQHKAIVRIERASLVHAQVSASDVVLSVRDSAWTGVFYLLGAGVLLAFALAAGHALSLVRVLAMGAFALWALYVGASHLVNRINVLVTRDRLDGWERPLPRHRASTMLGEAGTLSVRPMGRTYDVVVDGRRLVNVPHRALADELVGQIESHRARLARPETD
jgi:hypothetical protein